MSSSINPLSSASYASAGIAALLTPQAASGTQAETVAASVASVATGSSDAGPSVPLTYGRVAPGSMQAISQLAQGGYGNASSAASPSAAGASNPDTGGKGAGRCERSRRKALAAGDPHRCGVFRQARGGGERKQSSRVDQGAGPTCWRPSSRDGLCIGATGRHPPGSPGAKVDEALQELAKDSDRYIASAAQSLLSKMAGVTSNGAIVYKDSSQGTQTTAAGNIAQALSQFADETILGLARHMAAGSGDIQAMRALVSNVLRAVDNHSVIVMPGQSHAAFQSGDRWPGGLFRGGNTRQFGIPG